jgi:hypothetical protein
MVQWEGGYIMNATLLGYLQFVLAFLAVVVLFALPVYWVGRLFSWMCAKCRG